MKFCSTCLTVFEIFVRMGEAEALQHLDRFSKHVVVEEATMELDEKEPVK